MTDLTHWKAGGEIAGELSVSPHIMGAVETLQIGESLNSFYDTLKSLINLSGDG